MMLTLSAQPELAIAFMFDELLRLEMVLTLSTQLEKVISTMYRITFSELQLLKIIPRHRYCVYYYVR
jgi:hypothetical protein